MKVERVLVVHKKSLFQIYVKEHHDSGVEAAIDRGDPEAQKFVAKHDLQERALETVLNALEKAAIKVSSCWRSDLKKIGDPDLIITVGGDGTLLSTSHKVLDETPLLGINSQPQTSMGVLCAGTAEQLPEIITAVRNDSLKPIRATRLRVVSGGKALLKPCLNDLLFAHPSPADLSRFELHLSGASQSSRKTAVPGQVMRSSGLWIATATGSTAAIFSAGGDPLPPDSPDLQYCVREPYFRPQQQRKTICERVAPGQAIQLVNRTRRAVIWGDGAHHKCSIRYGQALTIDQHPRPLNLIRRDYR